MRSSARIKFIKSLQLKKYRKQEQSFVVEGAKSVLEVLQSGFEVILLVVTKEFLEAHSATLNGFRGEMLVVKPDLLAELGDFKTNNSVLAVVRMKQNTEPVFKAGELGLVLDDIRDPGNLGSIIRIADWYGIKAIIASSETADFYNSKVIHSSMGSFTRVQVFYCDLAGYLQKTKLPVMGTFLTGEDIHKVTNINGGLVVIGNEANGISKPVEKFITRRLTIPRYGGAESLNAAAATAIVCDNLVRLITGTHLKNSF